MSMEQQKQQNHYFRNNEFQSLAQCDNMAYKNLLSFCSNYVVAKNSKFNIVDQNGKKYNFPINAVDDFFTLYEACRSENCVLRFCEPQTDPSGLMFDFDIYQSSKVRALKSAHITELINDLLGILTDIIDFKASNVENFKIFVTQRSEVTNTGANYKDGFHILIPELWMPRTLKNCILQEIKYRQILENIFGDTSIDINKMLDMHSVNVMVLFLGSVKRGVSLPPYGLDCVYDCMVGGSKPFADKITLPIQHNKLNLAYELSLSFNFKVIDSAPTWLHKQEVLSSIDLENYEIEEPDASTFSDDVEADYIKDIIDCIDDTYAANYSTWIKGIFALANTSTAYKPLAHYFSKKCPEKYKSSEVDAIWDRAAYHRAYEQQITIATLIYWAKLSNIAKYRAIKNNSLQNVIVELLEDSRGGILTETDIAKLLYHSYKKKFACDYERGIRSEKLYWFEFLSKKTEGREKHIYKWYRHEMPHDLQRIIIDKLPRTIEHIINQISVKINNTVKKEQKDFLDTTKKNLLRLKIKLGSDTFQKKILNQCAVQFMRYNFIASLDDYDDIIGVSNGVLVVDPELKLIQEFHPYKICNFISTDFIAYDSSNATIKQLEGALMNMFVGDGVYEKIMAILSTALDRRPQEPLLLLIVGGGANGKSTLLEFILNSLGGDFAYKAPAGLLLEYGSKANEANSAQYNMKGKTIVVYDESDPYQVMNTKRLKDVTSITQTGRDLNKRQENYRVNAVHIYMTNHLPIIKTTDHGTWRRILKYETKVKFTNNPVGPYEKLANPKFMSQYPRADKYKQAMISILAHHHDILRKKYYYDISKVLSPAIDAETTDFRNSNDTFNRFVSLAVVKSNSEAADLTIQEVAKKYIAWHEENISHTKIDIQEAVDSLKNSKLSKYLSWTNDGKTQILAGCRVLESAGEKLNEGETRL